MASSALTGAVCVGAALGVAVYVLVGPDRLLGRRAKCPGLVNLGNTCFLNAVMQALAPLHAVRQWMSKGNAIKGQPLANALAHVLHILSERSDDVISPDGVLQALAYHRWRVETFEQQDAHELYHVLLTTLSEEMDFRQTTSSLLVDAAKVESERREGGEGGVRRREGSVHVPRGPPKCPLQGMLSGELTCSMCQHSLPVKYELFDSLSLTLPSKSVQCTLESCLHNYVRSEVVHGVECPSCSQVAGKVVKRPFHKRLSIGRLPECLCVHFNRTVWLAGPSRLVKNTTKVVFPTDFNAGPYMKTRGQTSAWYSLQAVVEHGGGPNSGHYITYRRQRKQWVYTSDTSVYRASLQEVMGATAYMLFYERRVH